MPKPARPVQGGSIGSWGTQVLAWIDQTLVARYFTTKVANHTLVLDDENTDVEQDAAGPTTVTIPTNATVPFPLGTEIPIVQIGAGAVTVAGAAGVTVLGAVLTTSAIGQVLVARKRATNTWVVKVSPGGGGGAVGERFIDVEVQATPTVATAFVVASHQSQYALGTSSAQNGFDAEWDLRLDAGTWTIETGFYRDGDRGQLTASFDGVDVGVIDQYGTAQNYSRASLAGVVVATAGIKRLRLRNATKHASSTGYGISLFMLHLRRTGA